MKDKSGAYSAACKYWSLPVEQRSFRRVAVELGLEREGEEDLKVENALSRAVRQWESEGKVRHQVFEEPYDPDYLPLLPDMEDEVRRYFGLRDVVVVDTTSIPTPLRRGSPGELEASHSAYDDAVHRKLGTWAARVLASIMRRNDVVGTGSGRGPYFTATAVNTPHASGLVPKAVVSLTGQMDVNVWQRDGGSGGAIPWRSLDADLVADLLRNGLRAEECHQMNTKITVKREIPRISSVNIALVGVGALTLGHRLVKYQESGDLEEVGRLLGKLNEERKLVDAPVKGTGPFHHWMGDLNNELFVVNWGPDVHPLAPAKRKRLEELVERINGQFHSAKRPQLEAIARSGAVLAVAGGLHKGAAIWHVLTSRRPAQSKSRKSQATDDWNPPISHLICDIAVARYLRNAIRRSTYS